MKSKRLLVVWTLFVFLSSGVGALYAAPEGWVNIHGTVSYNGKPVCAMVLANGQYMFSCNANYGLFELDVPLDGNGQITLFTFCSGLAPYKQVITPGQGVDMAIALESEQGGQEMVVDSTLQAINTTRVRLNGAITHNGTLVNAMVLANGKYMFSNAPLGSFTLDVPLDNLNQITLFGFCAGRPPYKTVYSSDMIDYSKDSDNDGYTINQGDCNDLNAGVSPGVAEICGDGIDQDCDGSDQPCTSLTGTWRGSWYSVYGESGNITVRTNQTGGQVSGSMDVTNTDCGNLSGVHFSGSEQSPGYYVFTASTVCQGESTMMEFSGYLSGTEMDGDYTLYVSGYWYDEGDFYLSK